jgi:hypothetical protein
MAEYINIRGQNIEVVASDPANPTQGQIWYNSTSNTLKGLGVTTSASWASGGAMPTVIRRNTGAGTQTAAISFGGYVEPPYTNATYLYNGATWSTGNSMSVARSATQQGAQNATQTTALCYGGGNPGAPTAPTAVEAYDGTSWTAGTSLPAGRFEASGTGTQTALLSAGGNSPETTDGLEYDGTTWTTGGSLSTARRGLAGGGLQTAAVVFGGSDGAPTAATEEYNGTSWTTSGSLNTARGDLNGVGIQTAALAFGGYAGAPTGATENYDGATWSNSPASLGTARTNMGGAGTQSLALGAGGGPPNISNTEEFINVGAPTTVTITAS